MAICRLQRVGPKETGCSALSDMMALRQQQLTEAVMRWICLIGLLLLPVAALGGTVGQVVRHEGKVTIFRQGAVRGETLREGGVSLAVGDVVPTQVAAKAWLLFGEDRILLQEDSSLRISGTTETGVERGRVLFDIRKRTEARGLQVVGPTATIGVKGTRFAVLRDGEVMDVYLKEGALEVISLAGEFQKYSGALQGEFERSQEELRTDFGATREKMRRDFEQSVEAMRQGDIEKVMTFDMQAGMAFRIAGQEVRPLEFPAGLEDDFRLLDEFPAQ
jgi:hypothetical protein